MTNQTPQRRLDLARIAGWLEQGKISVYAYGHHSNALKKSFLVRGTIDKLPDRPLTKENEVLDILGTPLSEKEVGQILATGLCGRPVPSGKPEWYIYPYLPKDKYGGNLTPRRPPGETWSDTP